MTEYELMVDEAEFRGYIASVIGEEDADLLSDFAWTASDSDSGTYMVTLAQISRSIAVNGKEAVDLVLAEAKKPAGEHINQVELAEYSKKLVEEVASAIGAYPLEQREKATAKYWKLLLRRMRKKLTKMYPKATLETVDKAVDIGCVWDKQEESFGIEPLKLVEAMRTPPSG